MGDMFSMGACNYGGHVSMVTCIYGGHVFMGDMYPWGHVSMGACIMYLWGRRIPSSCCPWLPVPPRDEQLHKSHSLQWRLRTDHGRWFYHSHIC